MSNNIKALLDAGLTTERLRLRKLTISDAGDMFEYTKDADNWQFIAREPHTGISQAEDFIKGNISKYDDPADITWGIELNGIGGFGAKLIGSIRIYDIEYEGESCKISYILNRSYSGKGYMREAINAVFSGIFEILNLKKIYAEIVHGNIKSQNVAMKSGMVKDEGFSVTKDIKGQEVIMYRYVIERGGL